MKISELIEKLQEYQKVVGDVETTIKLCCSDSTFSYYDINKFNYDMSYKCLDIECS